MSNEEIFAVGRVIERLMVCAFGGVSLGYGWNLFRLGVLNEQSAAVSVKGWRVNLRRVGPGVFFALFGCTVLAISLRSPLALSWTAGPREPAVKTETASDATSSAAKDKFEAVYANEGDVRTAKRWVASLNTILHVAKPEKFASAAEQKAISRAEADLEILRNSLVMRQFGAPLLGEYLVYHKKHLEYGTPGTEEERNKFAEIEDWMESSRIEE